MKADSKFWNRKEDFWEDLSL